VGGELRSAGWYLDPYARDDFRWWNGSGWTIAVTDNEAMTVLERWASMPTHGAVSDALGVVNNLIISAPSLDAVPSTETDHSFPMVTEESVSEDHATQGWWEGRDERARSTALGNAVSTWKPSDPRGATPTEPAASSSVGPDLTLWSSPDPWDRLGRWVLLAMIPLLMALVAYSACVLVHAGR